MLRFKPRFCATRVPGFSRYALRSEAAACADRPLGVSVKCSAGGGLAHASAGVSAVMSAAARSSVRVSLVIMVMFPRLGDGGWSFGLLG